MSKQSVPLVTRPGRRMRRVPVPPTNVKNVECDRTVSFRYPNVFFQDAFCVCVDAGDGRPMPRARCRAVWWVPEAFGPGPVVR